MCATSHFATDRVTYYCQSTIPTRQKGPLWIPGLATRQMPSRAWAQPLPEAMDVIEGFVPCGHPALTVSNALVALDADDDAALAQRQETVEGLYRLT